MKNSRPTQLTIFSFILILIASLKVFAAGGDLDPTFKAGLTNSGNSGNYANIAVVQADGKILVGGGFSSVDGRTAYRIVRLNADSTIDQSFGGGMRFFENGFVNAIVLQGDKILVGGGFSEVDSETRNLLVRLNPDGSLDPTFNAGGAGFTQTSNGSLGVETIALQLNGQILVGGTFADYNGEITSSLTRLNSDGSLDMAFAAALGTGFGGNGTVKTIAVESDDQQIVVGGFFTELNGVAANRIVRLNANGTRDAAFSTANGTGFNGLVYSIALQTNGQIVVGGSFSAFNGTATSNLVRLNNGTLDTGFVPVVNGGIDSIVIQPNGLILAGGINAVFGASERFQIGRVQPLNGSLDLNFNAGAGANGGYIGSLALPPVDRNDDSIFVTGAFLTFNNFNTAEVAKLNANGSVNTNFSVVVGDRGIVQSMLVLSDNRILIGGAFIGLNEDSRGGLARLNADGTTDTSFITGLDPESAVQAIAIQSDGKILIGGYNLGELGNSTIFRLLPNGSLDPDFTLTTSVSAIINVIAVQADGKILVGGQGLMTRLNADGTTDANFNTGTGFSGGGASVEAIVLQNNQIIVGGSFTGYNGITGVNYIARLNLNGSLDTTFTTNTGAGFDGVVNSLGLQNGNIVAGGFFSNFNGASSNGIVRLNTNGTRDAGFDVGTGVDDVRDLKVLPNGQIVIVGSFGSYNEFSDAGWRGSAQTARSTVRLFRTCRYPISV